MKYRIIERTKLNGEKQYCPQIIKYNKRRLFFLPIISRKNVYNLSPNFGYISEYKHVREWYDTYNEAFEVIEKHKKQMNCEENHKIIEP